MADVKTLTVQKTVTDLSTIEEVTLVKEFTVAPVSSTEEALSRLGNDNAKLLAVINDGLEAEERRKAREENSGWHVMTDEGEKGEAFAGQVADPKVVNGLVLTMAKTVFGYSKDLDAAAKKAAKENAMSFIKDTPKIREGLAKSAAQAAAAAE